METRSWLFNESNLCKTRTFRGPICGPEDARRMASCKEKLRLTRSTLSLQAASPRRSFHKLFPEDKAWVQRLGFPEARPKAKSKAARSDAREIREAEQIWREVLGKA